jgi:DNA polymerase-1
LLWEEFRPKLKKQKLWPLFADLETPLVPILAEMELAGIKVDTHLLHELSEEFGAKLAELEKEIYRLAGEEFNINSPRQLGDILFDKLKLPHGRKTKTGYSTDVKVLEKLSFHELPQAMLIHRNLSKLQSTYVEKLAGLVHPRTGRVHTSFNQTVTATGRLSSSKPNLQNIPIRTEEGQRIRQAFIPEKGHVFVAGDYSQIDLRVLAHYSQDKALLEAFRSGQDIHSRTAAEIFFVSPMLITKQMRRVAKTINFGIVYGMSSFGLAGQLNLSRKEAQTFIDRYFKHYAGVQQFMEDIVIQAREDKHVTTLLNRIRLLPDINSSNRTRREFAERTAINTPIQGTAADIIKLAMIKVDQELKKKGLKTRMLLQIHDELVFEVPEVEVEYISKLVKDCMESVMSLDVPLVVNISVGKNLAKV